MDPTANYSGTPKRRNGPRQTPPFRGVEMPKWATDESAHSSVKYAPSRERGVWVEDHRRPVEEGRSENGKLDERGWFSVGRWCEGMEWMMGEKGKAGEREARNGGGQV
ncbi:hypothetical protein QE152_g10928 [Popillia japonica]|uniref:Uncharacterized protein n=1 Tax=Popillia japonica TaxID=7064 RepID=A0AAW1LT83_POPJA